MSSTYIIQPSTTLVADCSEALAARRRARQRTLAEAPELAADRRAERPVPMRALDGTLLIESHTVGLHLLDDDHDA